ncbi:MAG TPA: hypothetical protein VGA73_16290 [Candidatus Binatia bacterium]
MITEKRGEAASAEIGRWANAVIRPLDALAEASVYYDGDSATYVLRLARASRVLVFRLSEAQVHTPGRQDECVKTLKTKLKNL